MKTKSKIKDESVDANTIALLMVYLDKNSNKSEKKKWDDLCCSGRWTRAFIEKQGSSFFAKRTIGSACAKVFSLVSTEIEPPIATALKVRNVSEVAKKLHEHIQEPLPYPAQSMTTSFKTGLNSLIGWRHSDCISLTSERGKIWRRWSAYELARELLKGFNKAPDKVIAELLSLLWEEPVDDAWVRSILRAETLENLRIEIGNQLAYETADLIASIHKDGIINSMKQVCTEKDRKSAEILMEQARRLISGKSRFEDDASAEKAAIEAISCISDQNRAQSIIAEIKQKDAYY